MIQNLLVRIRLVFSFTFVSLFPPSLYSQQNDSFYYYCIYICMLERIRYKMMDIYAMTQQVDLVEQLFDKITNSNDDITTGTTKTKTYHRNDSDEPYHALIKAYGNCHQPDRAEDFVRRHMLHPNSIVKPNVITINMLINAYAESIRNSYYDKTNASESAYKIYRWFDTNQECIQLNLRPNFVTYTTMLKCCSIDATMNSSNHSVSNDDNNSNSGHKMTLGEKIELLFQVMENRYKVGDINNKPEAHMYNIAIKALLAINDYDRAYNILQGMENQLYIQPSPHQHQRQQQSTNANSSNNNQSKLFDLISVRPTVRTYIEFLIYYNKIRTSDGAKLAEKLLNHMRNISQTIDQ
jgi:hypothetical protein